jgi:hypothetical protein
MITDAHMPYLCERAGRCALVYCAAEGEITLEQELARTCVFFREPLLGDPKFDAARTRYRATAEIPVRIPRYRPRLRDLETGEETALLPALGDSMAVCSPYLIGDELQCILSNEGRRWNDAGGVAMIKPAWANTIYGFRHGDFHTWATSTRQLVQWKAGEAPRLFQIPFPDDAGIYRVAPVHGQPSQWLLTYTSAQVGRTLYWDGVQLREILVNDAPVYKCSIFDATIAYAGGASGARNIAWQDGYTLGAPIAAPQVELTDRAPTLLELAGNFLSATAGIVASGGQRVSQQMCARRLEVCRNECPGRYWREDALFGLGLCGKCGCTTLKHALASQDCPIKAWPTA